MPPFDSPIETKPSTKNILSGAKIPDSHHLLSNDSPTDNKGETGFSGVLPLLKDLAIGGVLKSVLSDNSTAKDNATTKENGKDNSLQEYRDAMKSMEGSTSTFEDLFGKLDLDNNKKLSREEVKKGITSPILNKHEQRMAEIVNEHYDTIQPMGGGFSLRSQRLDKGDLKAVDKMVREGKVGNLFMNYVRSVAGTDTATGATMGMTFFRVASMNQEPKGRAITQGIGAALVVGSFVVGGIRGGINYYKAKSDRAEMLREIQDIGR